MRKGLFTVCGFDNVDHNPSSTTAKESFHGTAITAMQNIVQPLTPAQSEHTMSPLDFSTLKKRLFSLPDNFTVVPEVVMSNKPNLPTKIVTLATVMSSLLSEAKTKEFAWFHSISDILAKNSDEIQRGDYRLSWSSYHSFFDDAAPWSPALIGMLPVFRQKASSPSMVKHGMAVIANLTQFINPGQIPVMAVDQPLFAIAK
eukprot:Pompholyxophrys_punicea_v1_NODE_93_length_3578_cov_92.823162.p1 type:complete len:201 gc:universal NODE_93_length_3578_cov_92.823162:2879-2277(-)